jgi:uncharacterized protein (DUF433 family)
MAAAVRYPYIIKEEGKPARLERTPRVRISQIVTDYIDHGWSPQEMCQQYSYLSLPEAYTAMAYYFDNQAEIDAEIEAEERATEEAAANASSSPLVERLRAMKGR